MGLLRPYAAGAMSKRDEAVYTEQIKIVFAQTVIAVLGGIAATLLFAYVYWEQVPQSLLLAWMSAVFATLGIRSIIYFLFLNRRQLLPIHTWGLIANIATFIMGLGWGVAWLMFIPQVELLYAVMSTVWILGMAAAAVVAYSAQWIAMLAFFLPVTIPGLISLFLYGDETTTALGLGVLLAVIVFLRSMRLINRYMLHAIESKLDLESEIQERKKIERELLEQSLKDRLTGLSNRRHFDEVLDQELRRAERLDYPLTLILLDLDYFKDYNDNYGHLAGDACLREFATVLQEAVKRPGDVAARYGGEEFALILPNTTVANAKLVAERVQQRVSELKIEHRGSKIPGIDIVTCSAGIYTTRPGSHETEATIIQQADEALYAAKSEGRNRVVTLQPTG